MTADPPEVSVHIERLVLDGIPLGPGGADQVRAAVEVAVGQALEARGVAPALALLDGLSVASLDGGSIILPGPGSGRAASAELGRRVGGQLADRVAAGEPSQ